MPDSPTPIDATERWLLPSLRSCLAGPEQTQWRRWLGRAQRLPDAAVGPRLAAAEALALAPLQVPWVSALATADLDPEQARTAWLRLDRVVLLVDGYRLRLAGLLDQPWSDSQWRQLQECLGDLPEAAAWRLQAGPAGRAYLCTPPGPGQNSLPAAPATLPPDALLGADLLEALPAARLWRRLLNDCQVALSTNELAQAGHGIRQSEAPWLWGDATQEASRSEVAWGMVDDAELQHLLGHLGCQTHAMAGRGVREGSSAQPAMIVPALRQGPLWLGFACGARFVLQPHDRWRFWKPSWSGGEAQT